MQSICSVLTLTTRMSFCRTVGRAFAFLFVAVTASRGQATRLVDPVDAIYADLELLAGRGLLDHAMLSQRPLSRGEIGRLLHRARQNVLDATRRLDSTAITDDEREGRAARLEPLRQLVTFQLDRFGFDTTITTTASVKHIASEWLPLSSVSLDVEQVSSPTRLVPPNNGLGGIDAGLNPLVAYRQGRPIDNGLNVLLESNHHVESRYAALSLRPLLLLQRDSVSRAKASVEELSIRFQLGNMAVDVGRSFLVWGEGRDVGLLASNNSPPLDRIAASSESPFRLPWILRRFGPTRAAIFYADLGPGQNFPHAYLVGYKVSVSPTRNLELGGTIYTKSGGRGSPAASVGSRILDLFPFLQKGNFNNRLGVGGLYESSDHYAGFDGRWRMPGLGGAAAYAELLLNDYDVRRLNSVLWEDAGHVFGVTIPAFSNGRLLRATIEFRHTGIRFYEHHQFESGITLNRVLTGDALGPDGQGGYATFEWRVSPSRRLSVELATEHRRNDQYLTIVEPFGFERTERRPRERRNRAIATWEVIPTRSNFGVLAQVSGESVRNFAFEQGRNRHNGVGRLLMEYRFR